MLNGRIQSLGVYASRAIARDVEENSKVISLSIGEPEFGPPPSVATSLQKLVDPAFLARDLKRYERSFGAPTLRDAVAQYYRRYFDLVINPESQILITHGGVGALTSAILATTNPGDEVLVGDPSYMLYERLVIVLGRVPRLIPRHPSNGYRFASSDVKGAITSKTTAMIVNSPENPTGYVCPEEELRELVENCACHGMTFIHDEVYDQFNFSNQHRPAGALAGFENVVQINSMSKKFGVPGLRLGWLISNPTTVAVAARAQDYTTLSINSFVERLGEALLTCDGQDIWFGEIRNMLQERAKSVTAKLGSIEGVEFSSQILGGMFAFPSVSKLATRLGLQDGSNVAESVTAWLLRKAAVAVVPGSVYGTLGQNSIRIVVCGPEDELREALERIVSIAD